MKNYYFTYFHKNDGDEFLQTHEYVIRARRLSRAFSFFCDHFNSMIGIRDYSLTYRVVSSTGTSYRILSTKYAQKLIREVPDHD